MWQEGERERKKALTSLEGSVGVGLLWSLAWNKGNQVPEEEQRERSDDHPRDKLAVPQVACKRSCCEQSFHAVVPSKKTKRNKEEK